MNPSQVKFKASARFILNVFYIFLLSLVQCDTENNKKGAAIFKIDNYKEKKALKQAKKRESLFCAIFSSFVLFSAEPFPVSSIVH